MKATDQHKEFIWKKFEEGCTDIKPLSDGNFVDRVFPRRARLYEGWKKQIWSDS